MVSVWNPVTGALLRDIMTGTGWTAGFRFSPDRRQFLIVDEQGKVSLWETDAGRSLVVLPMARREKVAGIVFSPDGQLLASGGIGNAVSLWEVATGRLLLALPGHTARVNHTAFSPDGRTLASTSEDGTLKLWHLATQREITTLGRDAQWEFLGFSPNGQFLVAADRQRQLHVWEAPPLIELDRDELLRLFAATQRLFLPSSF